jgi:hypothetical protein
MPSVQTPISHEGPLVFVERHAQRIAHSLSQDPNVARLFPTKCRKLGAERDYFGPKRDGLTLLLSPHVLGLLIFAPEALGKAIDCRPVWGLGVQAFTLGVCGRHRFSPEAPAGSPWSRSRRAPADPAALAPRRSLRPGADRIERRLDATTVLGLGSGVLIPFHGHILELRNVVVKALMGGVPGVDVQEHLAVARRAVALEPIDRSRDINAEKAAQDIPRIVKVITATPSIVILKVTPLRPAKTINKLVPTWM